MNKLNTRAINSVNISDKKMSEAYFDAFVITATTEENSDQLNTRFHKHNFFELHFVTRGFVDYGFGNEMFRVNEGEMMIISPGNVHCVSRIPNAFCKIMIGVEAKPDSVAERSLLKLSDRVISQGQAIENELEDILLAAQEKRGNKDILVHLGICSLIYRIIGKAAVDCITDTSEVSCDDRVLSAKKYIQDNPDVFFTCAEVAAYCRLSTKQLGRLFKRYEGISLFEYIHKVKIEQAKHLLLNTDETQREIAKKLGFLDAQYFGKFFFRISGTSPSVFREKNEIFKED